MYPFMVRTFYAAWNRRRRRRLSTFDVSECVCRAAAAAAPPAADLSQLAAIDGAARFVFIFRTSVVEQTNMYATISVEHDDRWPTMARTDRNVGAKKKQLRGRDSIPLLSTFLFTGYVVRRSSVSKMSEYVSDKFTSDDINMIHVFT